MNRESDSIHSGNFPAPLHYRHLQIEKKSGIKTNFKLQFRTGSVPKRPKQIRLVDTPIM